MDEPATTDELVDVWQRANAARGQPATPERVARVRAKLMDAAACVVWLREAGDVVSMALAEPWCEDDGAGVQRPGWGHVSMVFVRPELWGRGVGGRTMAELHRQAADRRCQDLTLWTRRSNDRALALYASAGWARSGRTSTLPDGSAILQLGRSINGATARQG